MDSERPGKIFQLYCLLKVIQKKQLIYLPEYPVPWNEYKEHALKLEAAIVNLLSDLSFNIWTFESILKGNFNQESKRLPSLAGKFRASIGHNTSLVASKSCQQVGRINDEPFSFGLILKNRFGIKSSIFPVHFANNSLWLLNSNYLFNVLTKALLQPTAFFENKFYINLCWWKSDGHCIDTSRLYCELVQFCLDFCLSRIKLINVEILSIRKMNICATMPNISVIWAQTINQSLIMYWKISCDDPNHYYWLN